jgi:hypothetical protein
MSQKEFQRVKVIENAVAGRLRVSEAARLLQLSERQVQRLKRRYRPDSVAWVHHGNRGRPMPQALTAALRGLDRLCGFGGMAEAMPFHESRGVSRCCPDEASGATCASSWGWPTHSPLR